MKKKWKVIIPENVVKKMETLPEKDQKELIKAMEKLSENPYVGKPFNAVEIKAWENEKCKCSQPFLMLLELDDNEVHVSCRRRECDESFWCTKGELINGRTQYVKDAKSDGKYLEYKDIEFVE
ncbi:MAG TPA: hypothetical protein VJG83_04830 [archaeon]|nr:hypothetical protein [archaeon]